MPKKPYFESAIHHLLLAAKNLADQERVYDPKSYGIWEKFINSFDFYFIDHQTLRVKWDYPKKGEQLVSLKEVKYYTRGDIPVAIKEQYRRHLLFSDDTIKSHNDRYYQSQVRKMATEATIPIHTKTHTYQAVTKIHDEEDLSDRWAESIDSNTIDVIASNTACTAPELRYIHNALGNIKGKQILDLGCGLGEASAYFALQGGNVTAIDLSKPMLEVVQNLAKKYKVKIKTVQASVEALRISGKKKFDIVYVGNLFHHVDIEKTLQHILKYLKPGGILVLWEPVDYNPIINVYRNIATHVRSHDERPFRKNDIELFKKYFTHVETRWFWLTTLFIFVWMYIIERRDPNKERYWKVVVNESEKWKPLYVPLEKLDTILLHLFSFLQPLCWNVVLICKN